MVGYEPTEKVRTVKNILKLEKKRVDKKEKL
jgi:hypothetical protein